MLRMVFVVVFAFAIWFGYQRLAAGEVGASNGTHSGPELGAETGDPSGVGPEVRDGAPADTQVPLRIQDLDGAAGGPSTSAEERAYNQSFDVPEGASVPSMLAALGENNSFLHAQKGRVLAMRLLEALHGEPDPVSVKSLTRILELAMRGPIRQTDHEAKTLVEKAYAQLQRPLRNTVLNPAETAGARTYKVKKGDSLDRIAARFRAQEILVEAWTLAALNRITEPRLIGVDQVIKVPVEPIRTVVEKNSFLMAVYVGNTIVRLYWVGHGKDNTTPETAFTIGEKQERPDWTFEGRVIPYGHPDNLLGDYWIGFKHESFQGFGAHGTPEPESIGRMASSGCIRLGDKDIQDFFRFIPRGTTVEIRASR